MSPTLEAPAQVVADYVAQMHAQREALFADLAGVSEPEVWYRPNSTTWSIGENLDHLTVINASILRLMNWAWRIQLPWARRRRARPYAVTIDNVYKRPGFPQNVGWIWPPKHTPLKPIPLTQLHANLRAIHARYEQFYTQRDADLLGHVWLFDPVIGRVNLIVTLRIGLYHDDLHYDDVRQRLPRFAAGPTHVHAYQ